MIERKQASRRLGRSESAPLKCALLLTSLGRSFAGSGFTPLGIGPKGLGNRLRMSPARGTPQLVLHSTKRNPLYVGATAGAGDHVERSEGNRLVVGILAISGARDYNEPRSCRLAQFAQKLAIGAVSQSFFTKNDRGACVGKQSARFADA
jgi:hypothetical protein